MCEPDSSSLYGEITKQLAAPTKQSAAFTGGRQDTRLLAQFIRQINKFADELFVLVISAFS